jgi:hypothetical protein
MAVPVGLTIRYRLRRHRQRAHNQNDKRYK